MARGWRCCAAGFGLNKQQSWQAHYRASNSFKRIAVVDRDVHHGFEVAATAARTGCHCVCGHAMSKCCTSRCCYVVKQVALCPSMQCSAPALVYDTFRLSAQISTHQICSLNCFSMCIQCSVVSGQLCSTPSRLLCNLSRCCHPRLML